MLQWIMRMSQIRFMQSVITIFKFVLMYSRIIWSTINVNDSSHFPIHWCLIRTWSMNRIKLDRTKNLDKIKCFVNPVTQKIHRPSISWSVSFFTIQNGLQIILFLSYRVCSTHFPSYPISFKVCSFSMFVSVPSFVNWCEFAWINARCQITKKKKYVHSLRHNFDWLL